MKKLTRGKKLIFYAITIAGISGSVYFSIKHYRSQQLCEEQVFNSTLLSGDYSAWIKNPEDMQIVSEKARILNDYLSLRSEAQQKFESQEKELLAKTQRFSELYIQWNKQRDEFKLKLGKVSNDDLSKMEHELGSKNNELILIAEILPGELKSFYENVYALEQANRNFQNTMKDLIKALASIDQRDQALGPEKLSLFKRFELWELKQKSKCDYLD